MVYIFDSTNSHLQVTSKWFAHVGRVEAIVWAQGQQYIIVNY